VRAGDECNENGPPAFVKLRRGRQGRGYRYWRVATPVLARRSIGVGWCGGGLVQDAFFKADVSVPALPSSRRSIGLVIRILRLRALRGASNMTSSMICSTIDRNPLAPVPCLIAITASSRRALWVKERSMPYIDNSFWYWRTIQLRGSTSIRTRSSSERSAKVVTIGKRPTSSGINP